MNDPLLISPEQILATPEGEPERVFPGSRDEAMGVYRALLKRWHPDHCGDPRAAAITQRLTVLHEEAKRRFATGNWQEVGFWSFADTAGHRHTFKYVARRSFELGEMLLGREWLLYSTALGDLDLLRRGMGNLKRLRYANDAMQRQFAPQIPSDVKVIETPEKAVLVMRRRRGSVRLADLLQHLGGSLKPEHTAWLIRRLADFACFLEFNGMAHANLTPDSLFVVPGTHDIGVYDPWGLATAFGERLVALPEFAVSHLPASVLRDKIATPLMDCDLIKALGRQLLGIRSIAVAMADRSSPLRPILAWLAAPASSSAHEEYAAWEVAVRAVYPKREFLEIKVQFDDVYPERSV